MPHKTLILTIPISILFILVASAALFASDTVVVRVNQVGYLPTESKLAVIASRTPLETKTFEVMNEKGKTAFDDDLSDDLGSYLSFSHHYIADFTKFKKQGIFSIVVSGAVSPRFEIGKSLYHDLPDTMLQFFQVQRCGSAPALLHQTCHTVDACSVRAKDGMRGPLDLTGGWHDAGDYIKFTLTTSYSTYLLLLTYQYFRDYFDDQVFLSEPAILEEARIGLDWLMKMHPEENRLLSQVQDLKDHDVGWRMPENDPLATKRFGYEFPTRSMAASASAAFAIGSQVFAVKGETDYASLCLKHATKLYRMAESGQIPDRDTTIDSHYIDASPSDNIALAAVELYRATGSTMYLLRATSLIDSLGAGGWISWGDVQGLAAARILRYYPEAEYLLELAFDEYIENSSRNGFSYPFSTYPWGSANLQSGVAMVTICGVAEGIDSDYLSLAIRQRDGLLGVNSFGVSYVSGVGTDFSSNFHNQVSYLKNVRLPGGVAEGPIGLQEFKDSGIALELADRFAEFQSDGAVYHDDRNDFLCNEPTIAGNAQALFVFTWFAAGGKYSKR
jgi:hypothetical protein